MTRTKFNHEVLSNNWKLKVAVELRQHERAVEIRTRKIAWAKIPELNLRWYRGNDRVNGSFRNVHILMMIPPTSVLNIRSMWSRNEIEIDKKRKNTITTTHYAYKMNQSIQKQNIWITSMLSKYSPSTTRKNLSQRSHDTIDKLVQSRNCTLCMKMLF